MVFLWRCKLKQTFSCCSRLIQNKEDFIQIHGLTPLVMIPAFNPWRSFDAASGSKFMWTANVKESSRAFQFPLGLYGDILHVMDLQILPDSICGCLLDMTDAGAGTRDQRLSDLHMSYIEFCKQQSALVTFVRFV